MEVSWEISNLFRKKPKAFRENEDYIFVNFKDTDITGIKIIAGDYRGIIYYYQKARVVEEGEMAKLQFGYNIVNPGQYDTELLQNDDKFITMIGDILTQILMDKSNTDEQIRTDDSKEFNI
jgi:hypothetical protein